MNKKYAIILRYPSNWGKTSICRALANQLLGIHIGATNSNRSPRTNVTEQTLAGDPNTGDFRAVYTLENEIKIGITSWGDPGATIQQDLEDLLAEDCVITISACRSSGATLNETIQFCSENSFSPIYTRGYIYADVNDNPTSDATITALNRLNVRSIHELLLELIKLSS